MNLIYKMCTKDDPLASKRCVFQGTCGWSDVSLSRSGKFFPPRTSSSLDKLRFLSREGGFGCVEVNTSTYSIPQVFRHVTTLMFIVPSYRDCRENLSRNGLTPRHQASFSISKPLVSFAEAKYRCKAFHSKFEKNFRCRLISVYL